ncbi:MAG: HsdR family type I site-specific deoxyribonuclease [Methyloprofundus sp.]|nr:HsdR family type I site-specific deoxyribonuclease [Methyloprofundus sp.]
MSDEYSEEALVEAATQDVLEDLGWTVEYAWGKEDLTTLDDPSRKQGLLGRVNKSEVLLVRYLLAALKNLNPDLPDTAYQQAVSLLSSAVADKHLAAINKEKYHYLLNGVPVSYQDAKGVLQKKQLRVIDFAHPEKNDFRAVRQFEIIGRLYRRRPDIVGFVNGIPLVFFELKAHHTDLRHAFDDNLSDYKDTIPDIFHCNAFIILSNGTDARVGTVTSAYQFFLEWKRIDEDEEGLVSLDTLLRGTCAKTRLLDLVENFLLFDGEGDEVIKLMAKNHQYIGVNKVVARAKNLQDLKQKLGVFWHTQGSGKSYSMVFMCQKILRQYGAGMTFLIVLDRSELENQLYDTFTGVGVVGEQNIRAKSRVHLRELLQENHRYIFTLIHKFSIDPKKEQAYPLLTERDNIIVISDEAHRTQEGDFARNMRFNALPNAAYLGFTGTPIIKDELELTKNIFGDYVSVYDFKRSIEDGATLPLRYLNRGEKLDIDNPELDERIAEIINDEELDDDQRRKLEREFKRDYPILTSEVRLDAIAKDLVWHFNERGYQGKAMFVALDKPTAVRMYQLSMKYWAEYIAELAQRIEKAEDEQQLVQLRQHLKRVQATEVCVVVSPEQNELNKFAKLGLDIEPHRKNMLNRDLEKEFKDEHNPFRLAFVCAMWITGFDVPCVSTVYLDKPIKGHTLMQTIARANRVYDDEKENGLIVDYGNVYQQLEKAYSVYGEGGKNKAGAAGEPANPIEKLEAMIVEVEASIVVVQDFLLKVEFDLESLIHAASPMLSLAKIEEASNAVCLNETTRTQFEVAARQVFRQYKALYPEQEVKPFTPYYNALNAIYRQLNQTLKSADISSVMLRLQQEVNMSVSLVNNEVRETDFVDLSCLDFDKLRAAFAQSKHKNTVVFDLQNAIEKKLEQMVQENPIRMEFYDKYKTIIEEYNVGKDIQAVQKAFNDLNEFMADDLSPEMERAVREGLNEETLAIYDLLRKPELTAKEEIEVKKVAKKTLETLKFEKLKIERWRESEQVSSQVKVMISDALEYLPPASYPDKELADISLVVYQHVYSHYQGGGASSYGGI